MRNGLAIAILAAGAASRFGGGKLDAMAGGKRLGRHALDAALTLDAERVLIVAGDPVALFAREAAAMGQAELAINPRASEGLGTSVALAADHAQRAGSDRLLLLLADMPLVAPATLLHLAEGTDTGRPAAVRHGDGHPGIPACFPRGYFRQLQALAGDRGAGALLRQADRLILIETPVQELRDIDTPEDLAAFDAAPRS